MFITNTKKQFGLVAAICFFGFMSLLDSSITNIALPAISRSLHVDMSNVALVTLAYFVALTSTLIAFGKLGDKIGLKKIFICGYLLFTCGSFLCGISSHLPMLIISRVIQGLGGAMSYVISLALIPKYLPLEIRGKSVSMLLTACTLGIILGPPLGGLITTYAGWHWIFFVNVPFGIAASIVAYRCVPADEYDTVARQKPFDITGAVLNFLCIGLFCFVVNQGQELGWHSPFIMVCCGAAAVCFVWFIMRQLRIPAPLIDMQFFKNRNFTYANVANICSFAAFAGNNFIVPFFLMRTKGLSTATAGYLLVVFSFAFLAMNYYVGKIIDRTSLRTLCIVGCFVHMLAYVIFSSTLGYHGLLPVVIFLIVSGVGFAIFSAPINELVLNMTHERDQGIVSGIFKTATNMGIIVGVCVFDFVFEQAIAHRLPVPPHNIFDAIIPQEILYSSFRVVYIAGLILNAVAMIFSFMVRETKDTNAWNPAPQTNT